MSSELRPKEVLEAQIAVINRNLLNLGQKAQVQSHFVYHDQPEFDQNKDVHIFEEGTTSAGFWKHYIGGESLIIACQEVQFAQYRKIPVEDLNIRKAQQRAFKLINIWKDDPNSRKTLLEEESIAAFLQVAFSFDWATNTDLLLELKQNVSELGNNYMMLEGDIPLGNVSARND